MHVLFVHKNHPAQLGHVAEHLARAHGYRCTFVSEAPAGTERGVERIQYRLRGGARAATHYTSRTFENQIWHSHAVYEALRARPDLRPDLIVGHSGFASTLFLRELYEAPVIGYFEYFYASRGSDLDFRHDLPPVSELDRLRARSRNAMLLLDLQHCDAGYTPTRFQWSRLPVEYRDKVRCIFDGVDTDFWRPLPRPRGPVAGVQIPAEHRVLTYVSRGLESLRGFDVFMRVADRVCRARENVSVLVIGEEREAYSGDGRFTGDRTFKAWVLDRYPLALDRVHFVGRVAPPELVRVFARSDLHVYLTAPFVLSWSLFDAMACGATVLASDTAPVRELIEDDVNGRLRDFFDVEGLSAAALEVLDGPERFAPLGQTARRTILERYALPHCLQQMLELYESVLAGRGRPTPPNP